MAIASSNADRHRGAGPSRGARLYLIDCIRAAAVLFALLSHAMADLHLLEYSEGGGVYVWAVTRLATPALIIVFGMMVEIVYLPKSVTAPRETIGRLIERAVDCFLALLAGALLMYFLTDNPWALLGLPLLYRVGNFSIFQLYLALLPLVPVLLRLRSRVGPWGYFAVVAAVWAYDLMIEPLPPADGQFKQLVAFTGIGDRYGPTFIHSLQLVVFGMALGQILTGRAPRLPALVFAISLVVIAAIVLVREIDATGLAAFAGRAARMSGLRMHNAPAYYALGIVGFLALAGLAWAVQWIRWRPLVAFVSQVGANSFAFFFIGNVLLLLLDQPSRAWSADGYPARALIVTAYFLAAFLGLRLWLRADRRWPTVMLTKRRLVERIGFGSRSRSEDHASRRTG
jgi:hypothetical protein